MEMVVVVVVRVVILIFLAEEEDLLVTVRVPVVDFLSLVLIVAVMEV